MTVKGLIAQLLNYPMDAEVTDENGNDIKMVEFIDARNRNDICIKFKPQSKTLKVVEANACYTGGGIYIYYGKFNNGNYFFGDSEWDCVYECDADPDCEEAGYNEWCDKHCIKEYVGKQYKKYLKQWYKWLLLHKPNGNYDLYEITRYIKEEIG